MAVAEGSGDKGRMKRRKEDAHLSRVTLDRFLQNRPGNLESVVVPCPVWMLCLQKNELEPWGDELVV